MISFIPTPKPNMSTTPTSDSTSRSTPVSASTDAVKVGDRFGDYVVVAEHGSDKSKHKMWILACPHCGDTMLSTKYDLVSGRKRTICKTCLKKKKSSYSTPTFLTPKSNFPSNPNNVSTIPNINVEGTNTNTDTNTEGTSVNTEDIIQDKYAEDFPFYGEEGLSGELYCRVSSSVYVRELKHDLLHMPVYYNIAYCFSADSSIGSKTAKRLDEVYHIASRVEQLRDEWGWINQGDVGTIADFDNLIALLATEKKYQRPTMENLRSCIQELAQYCRTCNIEFLAMPRIGCGHNKLDWTQVKDMICKEFAEAYHETCGNKTIRITFCCK